MVCARFSDASGGELFRVVTQGEDHASGQPLSAVGILNPDRPPSPARCGHDGTDSAAFVGGLGRRRVLHVKILPFNAASPLAIEGAVGWAFGVQ